MCCYDSICVAGVEAIREQLQQLISADKRVQQSVLHQASLSPLPARDAFRRPVDYSIDQLLRTYHSQCANKTVQTNTPSITFYISRHSDISRGRVEALGRRADAVSRRVGGAQKLEAAEEPKNQQAETCETSSATSAAAAASLAGRLRELHGRLACFEGITSSEHLLARSQVMLAERRLLDGRQQLRQSRGSTEVVLVMPNEWRPETQAEELFHEVAPSDNTGRDFEQFWRSDFHSVNEDIDKIEQCSTALAVIPQRFHACREALQQTNNAIQQFCQQITAGQVEMEKSLQALSARLLL
eukprot:GHVS01058918.1.p1 GENE.GHVS01058918.1~~GHVS01058918.1.p1  ORF type:complete len:299 (+),score=52.73 GHVS01058918.1:393-1289(+)